MNLSAPILDVAPGARGLMLQTIVNSENDVTGRELARRAGLPVSTAAGVLADLVQTGIVAMKPLSNGNAYRLNRDHLFAEPIIAMAQALQNLTDAIRKEVAGWTQVQPIAGWLYGSAARGDGDRASDVDLFFVLPNSYDQAVWDEQAGSVIDRVNALTGNWVQVLPHKLDSFLELERSKSAFTANLRVDGIDLVDGSWRRVSEAQRGAA